jgi:hypothetical protein
MFVTTRGVESLASYFRSSQSNENRGDRFGLIRRIHPWNNFSVFPGSKKDYADDVAVNLSSMGEKNQHPIPDANAAPNFDINNLPPLPSTNEAEKHEQEEQQEILPVPEEEQIRASPYSRRNRAQPQRLGEMYNHGYTATLTDDPMNLAEVQNRPDWPSWKAAMDVELKALKSWVRLRQHSYLLEGKPFHANGFSR